MKLIVAGTRDFNDYVLLAAKLDAILANTPKDQIEIVSGTSAGADKLGEQYAISNNLGLKRFPADWKKYNKKAGPIRNEEMAQYATHCVCFWDGKSKGTANMIELANQYNLVLRVIQYAALT